MYVEFESSGPTPSRKPKGLQGVLWGNQGGAPVGKVCRPSSVPSPLRRLAEYGHRKGTTACHECGEYPLSAHP